MKTSVKILSLFLLLACGIFATAYKSFEPVLYDLECNICKRKCHNPCPEHGNYTKCPLTQSNTCKVCNHYSANHTAVKHLASQNSLGTLPKDNYEFVKHIYSRDGMFEVGAEYKTTRKCRIIFQAEFSVNRTTREFQANETFTLGKNDRIVGSYSLE